MSSVLVINSGSSSFKYQLIDADTEETLASGLIERIGEAVGRSRHTGPAGRSESEQPIPDHTAGFRVMLDAFDQHGPSLQTHAPIAVGHRVVHGGMRFFEPTLITDLVRINIEDLSPLAPLHNPANVQGIEAAQRAFPDLPHVAVFDTAFHQTMPEEAYTYAIDAEVAAQHRIRRYGFHGTSFQYVSAAAADFLGRPVDGFKQIILHLGNGASACAVDSGRSVETSMGMTPLEGLVMGSRSGDIDAGVIPYLSRRAGMSVEEIDGFLNHRSGLVGLSGKRDMRDVVDAADAGDAASKLTLAVVAHRLKKYVGGYYALLGHVDAIVFTAGIGENSAAVRARSLAGLEELGIAIDPERNESRDRGARLISAEGSRVAVLVIPTDEEVEIARQTLAVARSAG